MSSVARTAEVAAIVAHFAMTDAIVSYLTVATIAAEVAAAASVSVVLDPSLSMILNPSASTARMSCDTC